MALHCCSLALWLDTVRQNKEKEIVLCQTIRKTALLTGPLQDIHTPKHASVPPDWFIMCLYKTVKEFTEVYSSIMYTMYLVLATLLIQVVGSKY